MGRKNNKKVTSDDLPRRRGRPAKNATRQGDPDVPVNDDVQVDEQNGVRATQHHGQGVRETSQVNAQPSNSVGDKENLPSPQSTSQGQRSASNISNGNCESGENDEVSFSDHQFEREKAELAAARALAKIEDEAERQQFQFEQLKMEMEKKKLQREKALVEKELALQKLKMNEKLKNSSFSFDKPSPVINVSRDNTTPLNLNNNLTNNFGFNNNERTFESSSVGQLAQALTQAMQMCVGAVSSQSNGEMGKFVARQSSIKELSSFDGDPQDWPIFISDFRESTQQCSFTNVENMNRLRRCLKGKARDAVHAMLMVPMNVEKVIQTLENSFGRPEMIISTLTNKARKIPAPKEDSPEMLVEFSNGVENLVTTMETLKKPGHLLNPQLLSDLVEKLPWYAKVQWGQAAALLTDDLTLRDFADWLNGLAKAMGRVQLFLPVKEKSDGGHSQSHNHPNRSGGNKYFHGGTVMATTDNDKVNTRNVKCLFCNKSHETQNCRGFARESEDSRWEWASTKRVCFCCLEYGHAVRTCSQKKVCGVNGCLRSHHPLLHKSGPDIGDHGTETVGHISKSIRPKQKVLLKIVPVTLKGPKGQVSTHALIDDGSTVTLLESSLAEKIGAKGPRSILNLRWTSESCQQQLESSRVTISISGVNGEFFEMTDVRTVKGLDLPTQSVDVTKLAKTWTHLKRIHLDKLVNVKPSILIGQDNWHLILTTDAIHGPKTGPVVSKTKLGWVLHGTLPYYNSGEINEFTLMTSHPDDDDVLHQLVKRSFSTEEFGVKVIKELPRSKDDIRAQMIMDKTTRRVGDRWETGLLWKNDDVRLPESKSMALKRLWTLERQMDKDPEFGSKYCQKMEENLVKGYARKLSKEEAAVEGPRTWYLPHFRVINPNKPGKFRVVFDAAAKSHGVSLNDMLLQGPDLLVPLTGSLFTFRQYLVAFLGDIMEMFPQNRIRPQDCCAQRFVWRGMDRKKNPDVLEMNSMMFGIISSPCQAQEIKNKNAREFVHEFPTASNAIIKKHYMDDYLDSVHRAQEAIKLIFQVIEIHRRGGFLIRNWVSNSKEVLTAIPANLRANENEDLDFDSEIPTERVLGLQWNPKEDVFKFNLKFHRVPDEIVGGKRRPTKREILRVVMSIFDPLGFLAHFIIKSKILLQEIWRTGISWDDEVTESVFSKWGLWIQELKEISTTNIPRCYSVKMETAHSIQLHVFCDASEKAFAAVGYFRVDVGGGVIHTSIVMAKTRVAPLRPMSIPRLELQAALMGSRLAKTILEGHELKVDSTHFWSDSKTVLLWLRSDARKYKPFVAHRVGEIEELTDAASWNWISTLDNVADEATRDNKAVDWDPGCRWLNGPAFLKLPPSQWPKENLMVKEDDEGEADELELKSQFLGLIVPTANSSLPQIERFSSWSRLVRATAWVLRFIDRCRRRGPKSHQNLTPLEVQNAEKKWWKQVQNETFSSEISNLKKGKFLTDSSRLRTLSPFLDNAGILRVNGRTVHSKEMNPWTTQPIILDPKHRFTRLLIHHHHVQAGHHGQETVLNDLRQKFWILDMRVAVRSSWNSCQHCRIQRSRPQQPLMGPLPQFRTEKPSCPFTEVGMDYFGPLTVKIGRRREKRYGVLFTCLSTRAVHLELASSLTTDSAIMAIRRMIGRRGGCGVKRRIHSDNGTNLRGADRELKRALKAFDQNQIVDELTPKGIEWGFIPPSAPHMAGSWERLVRSVKTALRSTLKEQAPKEEVLLTLLVEAENIVNSRPLTHVSSDPSDPESLTPNHFLRGSSAGPVDIPGIFVDEDLSLRKQWRISQRLTDQFWKRWVKEYLPTLTRRTKWHITTKPIKIGDLVFIADGNMPRNSWPRGVVSSVYPGRDGVIRVVDVKTNYGVYRRPVSKLCILNVDNK